MNSQGSSKIQGYLPHKKSKYGRLGVECDPLEIKIVELTGGSDLFGNSGLQGYLAHKKTPTPLGPL